MFQMRALLLVSMIALLVTVLTWLGRATTRNTEVVLPAATTRGCPTLRIGLIPERDIFQQRQAYRALGDYLQQKLSVRVEQSTSYSYQGVLQDYHDAKIDVAFLGSLVAMLAVDRFDAQVVLKSETVDGSSSFAGVVFVPEGSPIKSLAELRGHTLGAVRTTTAGPLFVVYLMTLLNMTGKHESPRFVWSGTHDDVIEEVMAGRIDAGASKDLRLDAYLRQHPGVAVRRLATSAQLPDSALVIRRDVDGRLVARLTETLIAMDGDPERAAGARTNGSGRLRPVQHRRIRAPVRDDRHHWAAVARVRGGWSAAAPPGVGTDSCSGH